MVDFREMPADRVDPHVKLPSAIRNQSAAIDRFYEAQKNGQPAVLPTEPAAPAPPPEPAPTPPEAPTPPPDAVATPPQAPAEPPPAPADEPAPTPEQIQGDVWANRYNAMKGRLGAETKKFNNAVAQKDAELLALHNRVSQLSDEIVRSNAVLSQLNQRQPPQEPIKPLITQEDLERHGEDTLDFVQRAARAAVGSELETLAQQNQRLEQELSRTRKTEMNAELTRQVPNWREINTDKRFLQWLRKPNVYTGQTNKELLNEAARSADAHRVAAFFKGFLSEEKVTGHQPDPAASVPPVAPRRAAVDLASLASPGSGKPASGTDVYTPPSKPIYKQSDFERVRRAKAKGQYTAQQALAIEADMHAATLEGRIIKG